VRGWGRPPGNFQGLFLVLARCSWEVELSRPNPCTSSPDRVKRQERPFYWIAELPWPTRAGGTEWTGRLRRGWRREAFADLQGVGSGESCTGFRGVEKPSKTGNARLLPLIQSLEFLHPLIARPLRAVPNCSKKRTAVDLVFPTKCAFSVQIAFSFRSAQGQPISSRGPRSSLFIALLAAGRQRGTVPLWCVAPGLGRAALAKEGGCPNNRNPFCRQIQSEQSSRLLLLSEGDQRFFLPSSLRLFGRIGPNAVQRGQSHCVCDGDPFARRHWVPGLDTMCRAISPNTVP